jgi:hypothetical protein
VVPVLPVVREAPQAKDPTPAPSAPQSAAPAPMPAPAEALPADGSLLRGDSGVRQERARQTVRRSGPCPPQQRLPNAERRNWALPMPCTRANSGTGRSRNISVSFKIFLEARSSPPRSTAWRNAT